MKMRNDDLKKITGIKQYLLDPPVTFKLYDYALNYVEDAIAVLSTYPNAADVIQNLQIYWNNCAIKLFRRMNCATF